MYVCAHNCTDKTAEIAKQAGAIVFERFDEDLKKHRGAYPLQTLTQEVLKLRDDYDAFIRFDADNLASPNYLSSMNDAIATGVEVARGHQVPQNFTQNVWTQVCSIFYTRLSRLDCNFRERAHMNSTLAGPGLMFSTKIAKKIGGWDSFTTAEDNEFTCKRMLEKRKCRYVPDALVYEDEASTLKDNWNRQTRWGYGNNLCF